MIRRNTGFLIFLSDLVAFALGFFLAIKFSPYLSQLIFTERVTIYDKGETYGHLNYFIALTSIAILMFYNKGHYTSRIPWWSQMQYIAASLLLAMMVDGFVLYSIKYPFSRFSVFFSWIFSFSFILLGRHIVQTVMERMGKWNVSAILISNTEAATDILYALSSDHFTGCRVNTLLLQDEINCDIDRSFLPKEYRDIIVASGVKDYVSFIKKNPGEFYVISLDSIAEEKRDEVFELLQKLNTEYVIIPPTSRVSLYGMEPQYFFGHDIMFLRPRYSIHSPLGRFVKRSIDVTGALILITLLFPFLPFVAYFIRKDGGSVFYRSPRIGKNGRPFMCWKLRTMAVDAHKKLEELLDNNQDAREEYERFCKLRDDPRITRIGKLLRKGSIDELPQLINVIKGEMSLVGPRPILKSEREIYGSQLALYNTVKPGITGLWQVSGRSESTFGQRVYFDRWYIQNWSVWHDFVIMLKTIKAVFAKDGAY